MKSVFVIIMLLWGAAAHAQLATEDDVARFCRQFPLTSDQQACMTNLLRSELDLRVLDFCGKLALSSDRLKCAKNFVGKSFSDVILNFCVTRPMESDRLRCLEQSPSTVIPRRPGYCESRRVRLRLHDVLEFLQSGQTYRAEQALREVLNEIE